MKYLTKDFWKMALGFGVIIACGVFGLYLANSYELEAARGQEVVD